MCLISWKCRFLEHHLHTPDDFIELILAKLRIRFPEIGPGMNIIDHQLEVVAVNVVIQPSGDGLDAVVTLLPGIEVGLRCSHRAAN